MIQNIVSATKLAIAGRLAVLEKFQSSLEISFSMFGAESPRQHESLHRSCPVHCKDGSNTASPRRSFCRVARKLGSLQLRCEIPGLTSAHA